MEVIEKEKETVKEVPAGYYHDKYDCYNYGYNRYASNGKANAGVTLGIIGTALGALALSRNSRGFGLFGNNTPENVNINANMGGVSGSAPTAFQSWEKGCEDVLALTNAMWGLKVNTMDSARAAREVDVNEKFQIWKSQVDGDFGLYKTARDGFEVINGKINEGNFALYKNQRDNFDALSARIGALETKQAVADAVEPWRAKVLDMRINGVAANAHAGIALEAERRCCADNKIVNYVNSTFVPQVIANLAVGTGTHSEETYNPLCGCCDSCCNGRTF